ncbi:MAG: ATP cone domain-containing protein [bacterium]|nr:ATP cone domain-containing protein [bacterium]
MSGVILNVIKADGTEEQFDREKLFSSLSRAGADSQTTDTIVRHIENELVNGMATEDIYRHAFAILEKTQKPMASRYSLKRAVAALGPSGFPFEKFLAELFKRSGFRDVKTGVILKGKCVEHEVDLVAKKGDKIIMAEAKFHKEHRFKTDLKVALYVKARFTDLGEASETDSFKPTDGWLVTNTKFTSQAIQYGECSGLTLIGWSYPQRGNLREMIEEAKLHPITALTSITEHEKTALLNSGMVLCSSLVEKSGELGQLGIKKDRIDEIVKESRELCHSS